MSLSINLGRLSGLVLPRLPEIKVRLSIPNPFGSTTSTPSTPSTRVLSPELQQRLQDYLDNRSVEESFFIDNGLLKAVPKKKVSHQRKRTKQLKSTLKQLPILHHLNRCPSCGHTKRANTLCMHCVSQIKNVWKEDLRLKNGGSGDVIEQELDPIDKKILYPGKKQSEYEEALEKKDYIDRRTRTLPISRK
ncbi:CYFA0S19e01948g1_1 [Cyberlindnera fabianii]|uniref:Large ribosomal subunit protein bL32m n=1 Tax=Cyberlindnera fabianii TaxID=36022 RepID=A0A061B707_CYBFA|nr:hypothetical protein BON22_0948 [Cyberlindnera fabianii]CDR45697.1 CYFA0S19e01948g1_1 [Cyberlindnera fabianii]